MNERPMFFGGGRNLLGILTQPDDPRPGAPVVLLLNAGLLHRVGPNRLHVEVARRLARMGFASLRFDMSGVGDSDLAGSGLLYIERSQKDVVEAMDALGETLGTRQFVTMGLCTGAFNAFRSALADERVVGCVLIDGYAYPTFRSMIKHYRSRMLQGDRWIGYIRRKLGRTPGTQRSGGDDLIVFENEVVTKERFGSELGTLVDAEVPMLMVYTGYGPLAYTYDRQLHDAFPDIDIDRCVSVRFLPDADHTFTLPGNRERLMNDIDVWMHMHFANGAAERPRRLRVDRKERV